MSILHLSIGAFILSFFVATLLTPLSVRLARRLRFLDHPTERKAHRQSTPLLGGAAVFLGASVSWLLVASRNPHANALLVAVGSMALLGAIDDRYDLSSRLRLVFQIAVAIFL